MIFMNVDKILQDFIMCEHEMIRSLSDDCRAILPIAIRFLNTESAILFVERRDVLEKYSLDKDQDTVAAQKFVGGKKESSYEEGEKYFLPLTEGSFLCCSSGKTVSGEEYDLFVKVNGNETDDMGFPLYFSVFKLFIEHALLREKIVYDSEHDNLTGLFNKGKYTEMMKRDFPFYDSITIFNMDLNYLKRTNDTMGHDAGNKLIIKAAESLKHVAKDDIYAFRIGGDEFMLIAANADEEKVSLIEAEWRKKIEELNEQDPGIECVMACGIRSAQQPYDVEELVKESDELMYKDKRAIKISRGEDPDSR